MALFDVHPWAEIVAGTLIGCWAGAAIACAGVLLLVGRRVRQLEAINLLLRTRLKASLGTLQGRSAAGRSASMLVMPMPGAAHKSESPLGRIARVN